MRTKYQERGLGGKYNGFFFFFLVYGSGGGRFWNKDQKIGDIEELWIEVKVKFSQKDILIKT